MRQTEAPIAAPAVWIVVSGSAPGIAVGVGFVVALEFAVLVDVELELLLVPEFKASARFFSGPRSDTASARLETAAPETAPRVR